ncbi:hypothetical protein [Haloferula sp. BvORR071]|uniref:hypothetical protein n=1 Tax=Haloferula sp. BvORR071 TaxID=1396141 RepID=UPI0005533043|nr:hypothetical protein [Haloferula sp. BvORR071]
MFFICLLVEIVVLVCLAWMDRLPQFLINVAAGLLAFCFLAFYRGDDSIVVNLGVCALMSFFALVGGYVLWNGVRLVCAAIQDPQAAAQAIDTFAMERSVAKSLAGKSSDPNSYGNRRVAEEVVRALRDQNKKE